MFYFDSFSSIFCRLNPSSKDLSLLPTANNCKLAIQRADTAYEKHNYPLAKDFYNEGIKHCESAYHLLLKRGLCEFHLKNYYEAIIDMGKVLKLDTDNIQALEVRGNSYYHLGEVESAMNHYRKGLKSDPEHESIKGSYKKLKKIIDLSSKVDGFIQKNDYNEAVNLLRKIVDYDPSNSVLTERYSIQLVKALKHNKKFLEAKDLLKSLLVKHDSDGALHHLMGQLFMELEEYDPAIHHYQKAKELLNNDQSVLQDLQKAEAALKQSKQKDYYKILGVSRKASIKEIKKAYREQALQWHPDKHKGDDDKEKAEKQFQLVAEAYEILSDDDKRAAYDRGEDVTGNQGGGGGQGGFPFGQGNPFHHFRQGGGGGGGGGGQGGHTFHFQFG
jgi:DnaJ family protein C protein 3